MTDFAPHRVGHPFRSTITVAELLSRNHAAPERRRAERTAVSVSALVRREGYAGNPVIRSVEPRAEQALTWLGSPRRRMLGSAGAVLAVGSLTWAALMLSNAAPGATSAGAPDGGYPGRGVADQPGPQVTVDGLPQSVSSVTSPGPLGSAGLPAPAQRAGARGMPAGTPPTSSTIRAAGPSGVIGGGVVSPGGGLTGNTVRGVDRTLGPIGGPMRAVGDPVGHPNAALGPAGLADGSNRAPAGSAMPAGPAMSSLTKPVTAADAASGTLPPVHASKHSSPSGSRNHSSKGSRASSSKRHVGGVSKSSADHSGGVVSSVTRSLSGGSSKKGSDGHSGKRSGGGGDLGDLTD